MSETPFLIWSEEHGAWWRPGRMGYTHSIREAGRYSFAQATEIVESANHYLKSGFNEVMIYDPLQEDENTVAKRLGRLETLVTDIARKLDA